MYLGPDLQAYRTDTFEGWVKQPAEVGPVIFSNSSPSYVLLAPTGAAAGAGSDINWLLWGGIAAGVIVIAGAFLAMRRRSTADDRE
jgi:peptide/nickel transport system substrate-binding protein